MFKIKVDAKNGLVYEKIVTDYIHPLEIDEAIEEQGHEVLTCEELCVDMIGTHFATIKWVRHWTWQPVGIEFKNVSPMLDNKRFAAFEYYRENNIDLETWLKWGA